MAKIFSFEDIAKHNTRDDLWMVINGKVYDITAFVDEVIIVISPVLFFVLFSNVPCSIPVVKKCS